MKIIDVVPVGKPRMTQSDRWKQRPAVLRYRNYCDALQAAMPGYELPDSLYLRFYLPMPTSWSAKKKHFMLGKAHQGRPDLDNLCKAYMDAFKTEDSHVYHLNAYKFWGDTGSIMVLE